MRWPAASVSPSSSATCATRCSVPRCTCSGDQCVSVRPASSTSVSSTSTRGDVAASRASATVSPRSMSALSMPARFSAQRSPAQPASTGRFCAWMLRTRTSRAVRAIASVSPFFTRPANAVPVTTVPCPASVNTRSTASRNSPSSRRARQASAASARCRFSAATPGSSATVARVSKIGAPASVESRSQPSISSRTCAMRAASTRSHFVSATAPCATPSNCRMATCSRVCGITPSSAAITSSAKSMPHAPAAIV
ncbi:hypothetical protein FEP62_05253 [Burkholderia multivorans]|nr:hypothetical protein [Burkholderia multivorans]MDR8937598.1 hypothetical protein [Burkholderia multivorans]MDR8950427.1 hypothetical protein [Burkholderia multivorans]